MTRQTDMLSLATAAERLHTTALNVLMHIKRNKLHGTEIKGEWFVSGASLDALLTRNGGKADDVCSSGCAREHACAGGCK